MDRVERSPDEYLASLSVEVGAQMRQLDELIAGAMPGRSRTLWEGVFWGGTDQSILGYGDIVQDRPRGGVEWFAVGLARQKASFSIYVNAVEDGAYIGQAYGQRLGKVKIGAASIGFRSVDDLDLKVLAQMIAQVDRVTPPDRRL